MILAIAKLWYPDYEIQHWQQWIMYVALIWLAVAVNVFGASLIPKYNQMIGKSPFLAMSQLLTFHSGPVNIDSFGNDNYSICLQSASSPNCVVGFCGYYQQYWLGK